MPNLAVASYQPQRDDVFLFDTNILIYLFYPVMNTFPTQAYLSLYQKALKAKSTLLLPAIQLSEFINRCIRFQFSLYQQNCSSSEVLDFKHDYRGTQDYQDSMNGILDIIKNDIFPDFKLIDDDFHAMNPDSLLKYGFSYDFNDAFLVQIANNNNASIVTHDYDFGNYKTVRPIITDHRLLISFSTK